MQGHLIPERMRAAIVRAPNGMEWNMVPCETGLEVAFSEDPAMERWEARRASEIVYRYLRFFVRHHVVRRKPPVDKDSGGPGDDRALVTRDSSAAWVPSRRVFHLQEKAFWNGLDSILAGDLAMPAALPYPVMREGSGFSDRCPGWKLRNALKQSLFVLVPCDPAARSHKDLFACTLEKLGGKTKVGVDPFEVLEGEDGVAFYRDCEASVRQTTLSNFRKFKEGLEELCFSKRRTNGSITRQTSGLETESSWSLDISMDVQFKTFEVKRGASTVLIRYSGISSAWSGSRDWFELFYDSNYSPPKFFHLVVQWIVCSSVHMVNFVTRLARLAEESGFMLVRLPIAQLFPQPAPRWVWGEDQETNFDRLAFYPRRKLTLPHGLDDAGKERLYGRLLECFLRPPLNFLFLFASAQKEFKVDAPPDADADAKPRQGTYKLYQRIRGWVLCDLEALCLIALREDSVHWYENVLPLSEARDAQQADAQLQQVDRLRSSFYFYTDQILAEASGEASPGLTPKVFVPGSAKGAIVCAESPGSIFYQGSEGTSPGWSSGPSPDISPTLRPAQGEA